MGGLVGKNLKGLGMALNVPSDLSWATGVKDSVSKQFHRVNITPDAKKGDLSVAAAVGGAGYWVPYLGNGANNAPVGFAHTLHRGLGSYTDLVKAGGDITWVATGPFSGCTSLSIRDTTNDSIVCAHVITPADKYTADTIVNQTNNIEAQTGIATANRNVDSHVVTPPDGLEVNAGYVFWMYETKNNRWVRRVVWTLFGTIVRIDAETAI